MAWTTPGTAVAGSVLTAAYWNTQVRDNELALPRGLVAEDTSTSTQTFTAGVNADVTNLSVTVTLEQDRYYRIVLTLLRGTETGAAFDARVIVGSTGLDYLIGKVGSSFRSSHETYEWVYKHTTATASTTIKGNATANGANITLVNSAGFTPHTLRVFDLGFLNF